MQKPDPVNAAIANIVQDGSTRKVSSATTTAFLVPESTYRELLSDALAWRELRQHAGNTDAATRLDPMAASAFAHLS